MARRNDHCNARDRYLLSHRLRLLREILLPQNFHPLRSPSRPLGHRRLRAILLPLHILLV